MPTATASQARRRDDTTTRRRILAGSSPLVSRAQRGLDRRTLVLEHRCHSGCLTTQADLFYQAGGEMLRVNSPLTDAEEKIVTQTMDCGFAQSRTLGPGFRERIYQRAFCLELESRGLSFECEKPIEVKYKHWKIPGQKVDLVVAASCWWRSRPSRS